MSKIAHLYFLFYITSTIPVITCLGRSGIRHVSIFRIPHVLLPFKMGHFCIVDHKLCGLESKITRNCPFLTVKIGHFLFFLSIYISVMVQNTKMAHLKRAHGPFLLEIRSIHYSPGNIFRLRVPRKWVLFYWTWNQRNFRIGTPFLGFGMNSEQILFIGNHQFLS